MKVDFNIAFILFKLKNYIKINTSLKHIIFKKVINKRGGIQITFSGGIILRIIATLGPSISERWIMKEVISSGINTFRFNFSHGSMEDFNEKYKIIKDIDDKVEIMVDLPGSKIRISDKLPYIYKIYNGEELIFCGEDTYVNDGYSVKKGKMRIIPLNINNEFLINKNINSISMKDGTMNFKILNIDNSGIRAKVKRGGIVRAGKGCNIKNFNRETIGLTLKDKIAINWAIENSVNIISQSFVENTNDVINLKNYIETLSKYNKIKIFAKLETPKGIENCVSISKVSDGIILGRGDLVPESGIIEAPIYQDKVFNLLKNYNGELIIGTHILNSMKQGKASELAEVDSLYNLIKRGAKGFLLSGETSVGKAPIKTVKFLLEILERYKKELEL